MFQNIQNDWMLRIVSLVGIFVFLFIAWLLSSHKDRFPWRVVVGGLGLQLGFAGLVFLSIYATVSEEYPNGWLFYLVNSGFKQLSAAVNEGSEFLFNIRFKNDDARTAKEGSVLITSFMFGVLPTVIVFSSLMSALYYLGVMQRIVSAMAWLMHKTLGISGPESLSAAANVFVGHTEAPLVVKPYIPNMTRSEINTLMVGGFATITGSLMAAFAEMGVEAGHILTASVISAPAAIAVAKILLPEVEDVASPDALKMVDTSQSTNLLDAICQGASEGTKLMINIAGMLLAFIALIAIVNSSLGGLGELCESVVNRFSTEKVDYQWSLQGLLGFLFWPFAFLMGISWEESGQCGRLLGLKMVANEFVAYLDLQKILYIADAPDAANRLSQRSTVIMTYALCGFSNFAAIAIQIGGIGGMCPERRSDLVQLGMRAMIGGALACCITGCVAGLLL